MLRIKIYFLGNNYMKLYCLLHTGISLSDAALDALFRAACICALKEKHEIRICNDDVGGFVSTEFDYSNMGSICGILFQGEISSEQGSSFIKFIIPAFNIEEILKHDDLKWREL